MTNKKFQYVRGYEVGGVSPLPHYFEEIYGHTQGIAKIGPRGDKNYFWYSKDGRGAAYYEVGEQEKSAQSTYKFFYNKRNRARYFRSVEKLLKRTSTWIEKVDKVDLSALSLKQVFSYNHTSWMLDAEIFSYYLISQPYRLQKLEDGLRYELKKRVAISRIDDYLSRLTASEKITQTSQEELEWAQLIVSTKKIITGNITNQKLNEHPSVKDKILNHYDKYKILSLGDGMWEFDPQREIDRFLADANKKMDIYLERIKKIQAFSKKILQEREALIKDLYLNQDTVEDIEFLAEMSHVRYTMRVEGFIPLIYCVAQVATELALRLGYAGESNFPFMTHLEMFEAQRRNGPVITMSEIKRRRGKHDEYMLRLNNGRVEYYYGAQAGRIFKQLLPPVDHAKIAELKGVVAKTGEIKATATVYQWGDDMLEAVESIKKHPILVVGQTRPAMMPIIREAKGIITDEGGVTSHAAIVARELGIPTIINTHHATKVFKTGDKLLLDAHHGIVRKA